MKKNHLMIFNNIKIIKIVLKKLLICIFYNNKHKYLIHKLLQIILLNKYQIIKFNQIIK